MKIDLGTVIAERRLRVTDRPDLDVRVRVGMPQYYAEQDYYRCPYQVVGVGSEKVKYAAGADALQALELAIWILPTELDYLRLRAGYPGLGLEDAPDGDFGFFRAESQFDPQKRIEDPEEQ